MKRALAILAAASFVIFFVIIVTIANRGGGNLWWGFVDRIPFGDKLGHLGLTGTLSFLCNLAFPTRHPNQRILKVINRPTLLIGILLAAEELSQAFIPSRTCDVMDGLADLTGLALGQLLAQLAHPLRSS
jgi:VanZ family protein